MTNISKRVIAALLTFTMVFMGIEVASLPVFADELPAVEMTGFTVTPETLPGDGGVVQVEILSDSWPEGNCTVYYDLRSRDANKITTSVISITPATVSEANPYITIAIPKNKQYTAVDYLIRVNSNDNFFNLKSKVVTVAAKEAEQEAFTIDDLKDLVDVIDFELDKDDYTEESWDALQEVLDEYYGILEPYKNPSPEEIAEAYEAISAAKDALVVKPAAVTSITSVTATPEEVPAIGGRVKLAIEGTDITDSNWGVDIKVTISGTDRTPTNVLPWSLEDVTAKGATLVIPRNIMKNVLEYSITVGSKTETGINAQASTTVTIAKKNYSTDATFNPKDAQLESDNSVLVTFENDVTPMTIDEDIMPLFYVTDQAGNKVSSEVTGLTFGENSVIVEFKDAIPAEGYGIVIEEGALIIGENESGIICNSTNKPWVINKKPCISSITLNNNLFDHNGGSVTATLGGYRVEYIDAFEINEANEQAVTAQVRKAGVSKPTDIEAVVSQEDGKAPEISFDLPENTSDVTETYMIKVMYQGIEVNFSNDGRANPNTISVLPEGKTAEDQTLGMMTITAMSGGGDGDLTNATAVVKSNVGELKTEVRLYGTNLDLHKTKIRAIDENGIIWPVYDIPECDGVWRFVAISGPHKNGIFGEGNAQLIELLPPRYAGTNKTFTIQASIDGENWIENPVCTLTVQNDGITGESEFRDCSANKFKYLKVNYVDEDGKAIADQEVFKGYEISMVRQFLTGPKEIEGYTVIEEKNPVLAEWLGGGMTYTYTYRKNHVHTPVVDEAVEPTCEEPGATEGSHCEGCGEVLVAQEEIPATGHTAVTDEAVAPDCTKSGLTKGSHCSVCGKVFTEQKVIPAAGHVDANRDYCCDVCKAKLPFKGVLKKTSVRSLKKGKKAITVRWYKRAGISGYQIAYSTSKTFKSKKIKTVKGYKGTKTTIKKLKGGKKYFVKVRTYKIVNGKKYYSAWSAKKSVKTAK